MIFYIPEIDKSKVLINEQRRLMNDWNKLTDQTYKMLVLNAAFFVFADVIYGLTENLYFLIYLIFPALLFLFSGGIKKTDKISFIVCTVCSIALFSQTYFLDRTVFTGTAVNLALSFDIVTFASLFLCLFYYRHYRYLKKQPGFPLFVFNTDEKFKNELLDERIIPDDKKIPDSEKTIMNIGYGEKQEHLSGRTDKHPERNYHDTVFMGMTFKINYGDLSEYSYEAKAMLMKKWRELSPIFNKVSIASLFVEFVSVAMNMTNIPVKLIFAGVIIAQLYFISLIKKYNLSGYILYALSLISFFFAIGTNNESIINAFSTFAALFNILPLLSLIPPVLNLKLLKELSKYEGFPSFANTARELVLDETLNMTKEERRKEKQFSTPLPGGNENGPIVMNIGYDEPEKNSTPWNAFGSDDLPEPKAENNTNKNFASPLQYGTSAQPSIPVYQKNEKQFSKSTPLPFGNENGPIVMNIGYGEKDKTPKAGWNAFDKKENENEDSN